MSIKIDSTDNIKISSQIKDFLNPDYIYIPFNSNSKLKIKSNDYVEKGSILYEENNKIMYSPISGTIIGSCKSQVNNALEDTIVIENDFKEYTKRKKISLPKKYQKQDLINRLDNLNLHFNLDGKVLLINGADYEPSEHALSYITKTYTETILDTIDELISCLKVDKCYLSIKNNDTENVTTLINQIGTYQNIELKLMDDYYPNADKTLLIQQYLNKKEKEIYLTVEDIYNIHNAIKKDEPIYEKFITLTGNVLTKGKVLKVKIGTRIQEILGPSIKLTDKQHIIINGQLSGYETKNINTIITSNIRSIFIVNEKEDVPSECINCGLCHLNCPVNADPRTNFNMKKCLKCGLCNYICPSKIHLVGDKHE